MSDRLREAVESGELKRVINGMDIAGIHPSLKLLCDAARRFRALTETGPPFDANALYDYLDEEFALSEQVGWETFLAHAYDMRIAALADYLTEDQ